LKNGKYNVNIIIIDCNNDNNNKINNNINNNNNEDNI